MLPKVLPWLWRLADDSQMRVELPAELKTTLLGALAGVQAVAAAEDPNVSPGVAHMRPACGCVTGGFA